MKTLHEAISAMENKGGAGASLQKHLAAVGISAWKHITRAGLYDFRDHLGEAVAPSTAKTLAAYLKSLLGRYCDQLNLPSDWRKILSVKAAKPMKTYLNEDDLAKMEAAPVHTFRQQFVKNVFLICAFTGLRVSDAMDLTPENVDGGVIRYRAQKTGKAGLVPLKTGLEERIAWVSEHQGSRVTLAGYNRALRDMARRAGICECVVVVKGGKEQKGEKWQFISSHTARISTASNLNRRGVPIGDIMSILQHSSVAMTERYVIRDKVDLSPAAMAYFS